MLRNASLFVALSLIGCGSSMDAPAAPAPVDLPSGETPPFASASVSARAKEAAPSGPSLGAFGLVFQTNTKDWTNEVVIAPWGDVVAIGGSRARLLARDSGKELMAVSVCFTQSADAAAFVDEHRMVIACKDGVDEITFPEGRVKEILRFPTMVSETAVGGGRLVAGTDGFMTKQNHVTVYAIDGLQKVDEFDASSQIEAVAISSDGNHVAVGTDKAGLDIRDVAKKVTTHLLVNDGRRHSALHFSPDASRLFSDDTGSWEVGELSLGTGKPLNGFKAGSWIKAVRYVSDTEMLATGSDGLVLYSGTSAVLPAPIDRLGEGLDLSSDRSFFCAAGRDGDVACFSKKAVSPSTFVSRAPAPPSDSSSSNGSASSGSSEAINEVDGVLESKVGKILTVTLADAKDVKVGQHGELSKHFEQNVGFRISGFITIATFEVKSVQGKKVTLSVIEEKSQMTMNGKKMNQFTPKAEVKLMLKD